MNTSTSRVNALALPQNLAAMVAGAFAADAFSLGAHWLYDQNDIVSRFGRPSTLMSPGSPYHPGKSAGDFTHLGDQMWLLQQSVAACGGRFDANEFSQRWQAFWQSPTTRTYKDKATTVTLQNLERGMAIHEAGSLSEELAGATRSVPVLAVGLAQDLPELALIESVQEQTALTHRGVPSLHAAAFFARLMHGLAAGLDLPTAMDGSLGDSSQVIRDLGLMAESARLAKLSTPEAVLGLGQSCDLNQALPSSLLILARHGDSYEEAIVQNVLAGGDSAARGIFIGAVLGYVHGMQAIPSAWLDAMHIRPI